MTVNVAHLRAGHAPSGVPMGVPVPLGSRHDHENRHAAKTLSSVRAMLRTKRRPRPELLGKAGADTRRHAPTPRRAHSATRRYRADTAPRPRPMAEMRTVMMAVGHASGLGLRAGLARARCASPRS